MYKVNESPMVNSYANTVVDDAAVKLEILNDDVLDLVRYTKANHRDFSGHVNNGIRLFNVLMANISLPEFSWGEKVIVASSMTSSNIDVARIEKLPMVIFDVMNYEFNPADLSELSVSEKDLVEKIKALDFVQRIKLLYTVYHEFF